MKNYTTGQVADLFGISKTHVARLFDSGDLKGYVIPFSGHRRIPEESLREWASRHGLIGNHPEPAACPSTAPAASASS
jgi:excisionase family DNA binding protein